MIEPEITSSSELFPNLASDSQELIKLTTIRLLEETLLAKLTKLTPDTIQKKNNSLPWESRQKFILKSIQGERRTILEKIFKYQ